MGGAGGGRDIRETEEEEGPSGEEEGYEVTRLPSRDRAALLL
jgi:hypothetical protein